MQTQYNIPDWTGSGDIGEFAEFVAGASKQLDDSAAFREDIQIVSERYGVGFLEAFGILFGRKKIAEVRAKITSEIELLVTDEIVARVLSRSSEEGLKAVTEVMDQSGLGGLRVTFRIFTGPEYKSGFEIWLTEKIRKDQNQIYGQGAFEKTDAKKTIVNFVTDVAMAMKKELVKYSK